MNIHTIQKAARLVRTVDTAIQVVKVLPYVGRTLHGLSATAKTAAGLFRAIRAGTAFVALRTVR